jgi:hypothetical protein
MGASPWKTVVILLVLLTAVPAAIFLYNALRANGGLGLGGSSAASEVAALPTATPPPLVCRSAEKFEIRNASVESTRECCTASVVGQISNTCDRSLSVTIAAALVRSGTRRIVAIGTAESTVSSLGTGESTFFRVDFSGQAGWAAAQRDDVIPDVKPRMTTGP